MSRTAARGLRGGFTLIELVVAVSLTLAVFAITLPFVRAQTRSLGSTAGRLDAEQIARYAQRVVDEELRLAIADPGQSMIVYAGGMGIAFNVNLKARDTTDANALEVDVDADSSETEAWRVASASPIPLTARSYPTEDYVASDGSSSRNETVSYFLHSDTISDRSDIYVLYRRVNALDSVLITRGIHVPTDSAFFTYLRMVNGSLTAIPTSELPLYWDSTATADIRAILLRSAGFYRNNRENTDVIRTVYWTTVLGNFVSAGRDCGDAPSAIPTSGFTHSKTTASRPFRISIAWNDSPDDATGDKDVSHYLIERRRSTGSVWTTLATVPATRSTSYDWYHTIQSDTGTFKYGVRVVDCGGNVSSRVEQSGTETFP